jgi:hypothetical protein
VAQFPLSVGTGSPGHSQSLSLLEREMIADEFQRRSRGVTSAQQQRQIGDCLPQSFVVLRSEESLIRRVRAAMSLIVRTHFTWPE